MNLMRLDQEKDQVTVRSIKAGEQSDTQGKWPTFIGVGAAKAGTTSVYHYLRHHPMVYVSPIKETNYFASDIDPSRFTRFYKLHERQKKFDAGIAPSPNGGWPELNH